MTGTVSGHEPQYYNNNNNAAAAVYEIIKIIRTTCTVASSSGAVERRFYETLEQRPRLILRKGFGPYPVKLFE